MEENCGMYVLFLLIKTSNIANFVGIACGSFVYAGTTWLFVAFLNHRTIHPIVWPLLAVLGVTDAVFMWTFDIGSISHGSLIRACICISVWYLSIPVILKNIGLYDDAYPSIRLSTIIWWVVYSMTFVSLVLTLFGVPMLFKDTGAGVTISGSALISWIVTIAMFKYNGNLLLRWLLNRLRSFKFS
jgi:hypothetical protein